MRFKKYETPTCDNDEIICFTSWHNQKLYLLRRVINDTISLKLQGVAKKTFKIRITQYCFNIWITTLGYDESITYSTVRTVKTVFPKRNYILWTVSFCKKYVLGGLLLFKKLCGVICGPLRSSAVVPRFFKSFHCGPMWSSTVFCGLLRSLAGP